MQSDVYRALKRKLEVPLCLSLQAQVGEEGALAVRANVAECTQPAADLAQPPVTTSVSTKTGLTQPLARAGRQQSPGRSHVQVAVDSPDPVVDAGLVIAGDEDRAIAEHPVGQRDWCVVEDNDRSLSVRSCVDTAVLPLASITGSG